MTSRITPGTKTMSPTIVARNELETSVAKASESPPPLVDESELKASTVPKIVPNKPQIGPVV